MSIQSNVNPMRMVYAMTNAIHNEIAAFVRDRDGTLREPILIGTGGRGTGTREVSPATPDDGIDPLASQGSLFLSQSGRYLFAVNAGNNTVSMFSIGRDGLPIRSDNVPSGGEQPNCLAMHGKLLYVCNVGSAANRYASNVTGFFVDRTGHLRRLMDATYALSTPRAQPAGISFSPSGRHLVVSELTSNRLSVFSVKPDGTLGRPIINDSSGEGPFGLAMLSSGLMLNAEAGSNALSSYTLSTDGMLNTISGSVPSGQMATCWVVCARDGRYAYTSNAASGTITLYGIQDSGTLRRMESVPSTPQHAPMGATTDIGISRDGRNLYVLNGNLGTISVFFIHTDGQLERIQIARSPKLPKLGMQGLAVL